MSKTNQHEKINKMFDGVNKTMVKNALIEMEVWQVIEKNGWINEHTKNVDYRSLYEYFFTNHFKDLSLYKMNKKSGYDCIILYKGVARVGIADFMTGRAKQMEKDITKISDDWPVYQTNELKRKILNNLFEDPYDHRKTPDIYFKPIAEKTWSIIEKTLEATL